MAINRAPYGARPSNGVVGDNPLEPSMAKPRLRLVDTQMLHRHYRPTSPDPVSDSKARFSAEVAQFKLRLMETRQMLAEVDAALNKFDQAR